MRRPQASNDTSKLLYFVGFIFILVWVFLLVSVLDNSEPPAPKKQTFSDVELLHGQSADSIKIAPSNVVQNFNTKLQEPKRYEHVEAYVEPAPMAEIERNMTLYLTTLHSRLTALAGPSVDSLDVWEAFLEVTKEMPMTWDEQNAYRFPKPRDDGSIFVSLGTYRDPFCPMTIKSLYKNAKNPDKIVVGMFQQNCFGPKCRTGRYEKFCTILFYAFLYSGVLVGGKVDDAGPDMDCYVEFCKSAEGIASGACLNGNVRLFNVNESESLGPYMARYLGAKFYRGMPSIL